MPFDLDSVPKLEEATIGAFERDGFVRIKSLLSAQLLDHFGPQISQEVARRNPITVPLDERDTYHRAFIQVTNL